jgi:hypothetical protein
MLRRGSRACSGTVVAERVFMRTTILAAFVGLAGACADSDPHAGPALEPSDGKADGTSGTISVRLSPNDWSSFALDCNEWFSCDVDVDARITSVLYKSGQLLSYELADEAAAAGRDVTYTAALGGLTIRKESGSVIPDTNAAVTLDLIAHADRNLDDGPSDGGTASVHDADRNAQFSVIVRVTTALDQLGEIDSVFFDVEGRWD